MPRFVLVIIMELSGCASENLALNRVLCVGARISSREVEFVFVSVTVCFCQELVLDLFSGDTLYDDVCVCNYFVIDCGGVCRNVIVFVKACGRVRQNVIV